MKITFCIVTYQQDFNLLKRLINSIERNWDYSCIEEILIVVNDTAILDINSSLNLRIIYTSTPVYNWYSQQVIKLNLAKYVKTNYFIIHDSKDYYTDGDKIDLSYFFNDKEQSIGSWFTAPNYTHFITAFKNAYNLWGLDFNSVKGKLNEHTPIICKKDVFLELIDELKDIDLLDTISNHVYTEFSLMSAYIEHKQLQDLYLKIEDNPNMFFKIQPRVKADRSLQNLN